MTLPLKPLNTGAECIEFMANHDWYSQTEENTRAIAAKLGLDLTGELTADQCLDIWEEAGKHWTEKPHPSPTANETRQPVDEDTDHLAQLKDIAGMMKLQFGMTYPQTKALLRDSGVAPKEYGLYLFSEVQALIHKRQRKLAAAKSSAANMQKLRVPAIVKCPHCGGLL